MSEFGYFADEKSFVLLGEVVDYMVLFAKNTLEDAGGVGVVGHAASVGLQITAVSELIVELFKRLVQLHCHRCVLLS